MHLFMNFGIMVKTYARIMVSRVIREVKSPNFLSRADKNSINVKSSERHEVEPTRSRAKHHSVCASFDHLHDGIECRKGGPLYLK